MNQKIWEEHFLKVYRYYKINGSYPTIDDEENDGRWLVTQRYLLRKGKLNQIRKNMLDTAMPDWFNGNKKTNWVTFLNFEEHLNVVKNYYLKNGVLPGATDNENGGKWLVTQRYLFNSGKLSMKRKKMLDDNLPGWLIAKKGKMRDDSWIENLEKVKKYYLENGILPSSNDSQNGGAWWCRQLMLYYKNSNLPEHRKKWLQAAMIYFKETPFTDEGFDSLEEIKKLYAKLFLRNDFIWILNLEKVKVYRDTFGHFPKFKDRENGGLWLVTQRYRLSQGLLDEGRKNILDKFLPGWDIYKKKVKKIENYEQINNKGLVRKK